LTAAQVFQIALRNHQLGLLAEAEACYRQALALHADYPEAHNNLGNVLTALGRAREAEQHFRRTLALSPDSAVAHNNLGKILAELGRSEEAERSIRKALELQPQLSEAHNDLGALLQKRGQLEEAEQCYRAAAALKPDLSVVHGNLGTALLGLGKLEEAERSFRRALALEPASAQAHNNLGLALTALGRQPEAERCFRQALALKPDFADAYNNLANALTMLGQSEEAERSYRRVIALKPEVAAAFSNLLFFLNHVPGRRPEEIYAEHREFNRRFGGATAPAPHGNAPDPARRLRIGYVSGDLREHPVIRFFEPVLERHERRDFEIFCYYNYARADAATARLKSLSDHWRDVSAMDDAELAGRIRDDAIDVLVDLSGHTANNRLPALGRKPAPVQASWLGYPNTTGLDAMDYRITDALVCPEGQFDALHTEKLIRVPGCQWCYRPPAGCPDVAPSAVARTGVFTFAVFASPAKIGKSLIELWSRLLERVPISRLLVVYTYLASVPQELVDPYLRSGIDPRRLVLRGSLPLREHLELHNAADLILDTLPYAGGTSTCTALWMGVPVIGIVGHTATSRAGASLLHAVGLDELVAESPDQYLEIAAALAADPARLGKLHSGMRKRMAASPLMNEESFTRNLEKAYRAMWRVWCKNQN
jgi:predicted O-linked N-acetylglucosamine transferase (SPINDLY family)